ncbi:MAG: hypothetical protein B7Y65_02195 [Azorhizobium sp. 35-67-15]|nr:MAG: hypothetical protein B7Y65_02195 [Azorhizobium sp. 35-67-15]OZA89769.1 MAG: hypothetical protein B7X76_04240 [Azorhizobium sp. 39-67-5]
MQRDSPSPRGGEGWGEGGTLSGEPGGAHPDGAIPLSPTLPRKGGGGWNAKGEKRGAHDRHSAAAGAGAASSAAAIMTEESRP